MHTTAMKACLTGSTEKAIAAFRHRLQLRRQVSLKHLTMHGESSAEAPPSPPLRRTPPHACDAGKMDRQQLLLRPHHVTPISGRFTSRQRTSTPSLWLAVIERARPDQWMDMHPTSQPTDESTASRARPDARQHRRCRRTREPRHTFSTARTHDGHDARYGGPRTTYVGVRRQAKKCPSTQFGTNCLRCGRRIQP